MTLPPVAGAFVAAATAPTVLTGRTIFTRRTVLAGTLSAGRAVFTRATVFTRGAVLTGRTVFSGGLGHHFGGYGLSALAVPSLGPDALTGMAQLGDQAGLLELADRAQDLAHHLGRWRRVGEVGCASTGISSMSRSHSSA